MIHRLTIRDFINTLRGSGQWLAISLACLSGCATDFDATTQLYCPPATAFRSVSAVMEKRCGTLDCHGALGRPLRLFGKDGQRFFGPDELADPRLAIENGTIPGGRQTTTEEELELNRRAICGLEPEKMTEVLHHERAPSELLVMRKPLGDATCNDRDHCDRHKGGQLYVEGGAGARCVESWLSGGPVRLASCRSALLQP